MSNIKLKKLLQENMRRFGTKNLNELKSVGQTQRANPDDDGNWRFSFNEPIPRTSPNSILGWWTDVYYLMANKLASIAQELEMGGNITKYSNEISQISKATMECVNKVKTIRPDIYTAADDSAIIDDIKDEMIDELKELMNPKYAQQPSTLAEKLADIADTYQTVSEAILELSWDFQQPGKSAPHTN